MDSTLLNSLEKAGVRQNVIEILEEEEFDTVGLLQNTSDELLKACNIKGGQIVRIRNALATCILSQDEQGTQEKDGMATEFQGIVRSSTPRETPSTPTPSTPRPTPCTPRPTPSTPRPTPSIPREIPSTPTPSTPTPSTPRPSTPRPSMSSAFGMDIQPPSDGPSPTCSSFAIKEKYKGNRNQSWIKDFKLPDSFSPSVNEGLKAGQLSGNTRDEFTRDICTAIKTHSLYPTKAEKDRVASLIVQKYPFLEDSIGAGLGSWSKAVTNRFKNLRRKKTPRTIASVMKPNAEQPSAPKKRKLCDDPPKYAEGETEETCKEHTKVLKKEMARTSNKNQSLIKELMCLTYPYRRQNLLLKTKGINDIVAEFPALQLVSEIKAEFDRILSERKVVRRMVENYKAVQQKILDVAAKSPNKNTKRIISDMGSMVSEEPEKKSDIESTASVLALQSILKEKAAGENLFFMICPEDQSIDEAVSKTTYPRLIGCGDLSQLDPFVVAAEGQVFTKLSSVTMPFAVALLLATFYVFNIEYTRGVSNVYAFLEAIMLNRPEQAKKRISVQKFLKELNM